MSIHETYFMQNLYDNTFHNLYEIIPIQHTCYRYGHLSKIIWINYQKENLGKGFATLIMPTHDIKNPKTAELFKHRIEKSEKLIVSHTGNVFPTSLEHTIPETPFSNISTPYYTLDEIFAAWETAHTHTNLDSKQICMDMSLRTYALLINNQANIVHKNLWPESMNHNDIDKKIYTMYTLTNRPISSTFIYRPIPHYLDLLNKGYVLLVATPKNTYRKINNTWQETNEAHVTCIVKTDNIFAQIDYETITLYTENELHKFLYNIYENICDNIAFAKHFNLILGGRKMLPTKTIIILAETAMKKHHLNEIYINPHSGKTATNPLLDKKIELAKVHNIFDYMQTIDKAIDTIHHTHQSFDLIGIEKTNQNERKISIAENAQPQAQIDYPQITQLHHLKT